MGQIELFRDASDPEELLPRGGRALLYRSFWPSGLFERIDAAAGWERDRLFLGGEWREPRRLSAYYGEHPYAYSGAIRAPRPMPELLARLAREAEAAAGFRFNSVLCHRYPDGAAGMGYHRDAEAGMDVRCIASASFGATRRFLLRSDDGETVKADLPDGSLLLMLDCQARWRHAVAKTKKPVGPRINLTFRRIGPGRE